MTAREGSLGLTAAEPTTTAASLIAFARDVNSGTDPVEVRSMWVTASGLTGGLSVGDL
jgi:hypothetical protein